MAGKSRTLTVVIAGDTSKATKAFKDVDAAAGKTETRMSRASTAFKVAGAAAAGALVVGLKKSADAAIEAQKSQIALEAQLKQAGISYAAHAKQIDSVIAKTSRLAAVDDEDLQDAFTNIVRTTGDVTKALNLVGLTADIAAARHLDLRNASDIVAKVAGGNTGILSRYGIVIEKGATATEALGELQKRFGGQAAAYGKTSAGALDRIGIASENLQEKIGSALLPVVARLANGLARLIGWFERNRTATTGLIAALGAAAVAWAGYTAAAAAAAVATTVATGGLTLIIPVLAAFSAAVAVAYKRSATFRNVVDQVWSVMKVAVPQILLVRTAISRAGDAFDVAKTAARGVGSAVQNGIIDPFNKIIDAGRKVASVLGSVKSAIGSVGSVAGDIGGALNPFGDGLGRVPDLTAPIGPAGPLGTGGGGLMGADRALAPFAAIGARAGLQVTSGKRAAGGRTSSGGISFHGSGEAIDISGSPAGMMSTFRALKSKYGSRLAELIYTPGGQGVKNGRPFTYTGSVAADHFDHVHVALDLGRPGPGIGDGPGKARAAGRLSGVNLAIDAARKAGFSGNDLVNMVAIAGRESSYNPNAQNLKYPDHSIGLWQINQLAHKGKYGSDAALKNAYTNARAARALFKAAGLSPWQHAGGPLGGTNVAAARKAVAAFKGGGSSSGSSRSSGASSGVGSDEPTENELASSLVGVNVAEAQAALPDPDAKGLKADKARSNLAAAKSDQRKVVGARIRKIRAALRKKLRPATRVRLNQELAGLIGEHAQLGQDVKELRAGPDAPATGADAGDTGDPNQPLIDAINAKAEQDRELAEQQRQATEAHTAALLAVADAQSKQTKFAAAVQGTAGSQALRFLADYFNGQVGAGVTQRLRTAGTGAIPATY